MKLNQQQVQSFVMAQFNTYGINGFSIDNDKAQKEIKEELLKELEDLNSDSTKKARLERFKIKNATKEDYCEKRFIIGDNKEVICGIRNMGCNPDIPFIQLLPNFEISSKKEALTVYELIKKEFEVFKPLYLSFQTKNKIDADFYGSVHMVSNTKMVTNKDPWPLEESICFENITDNSYFDWYEKGYSNFHIEVPELKSKVTVNGVNLMEGSIKQGLLKYIIFGGKRIGLIAGEKSHFLGKSAIYFNEIFIAKKWKGKGLAKAIQIKFIEEFCGELDIVWGTIDLANLPSYKTAYSNERRPIRYECFINLN